MLYFSLQRHGTKVRPSTLHVITDALWDEVFNYQNEEETLLSIDQKVSYKLKHILVCVLNVVVVVAVFGFCFGISQDTESSFIK